MATIDTTDVDTIRAALAAKIESIVPRYSPRQSERFAYAQDQEIAGGSTFRTFDVVPDVEEEVPGGWWGGGVEFAVDVEIRVSYPVSEADVRRFAGSDGIDLAAILIDLHEDTAGVLAVSADGPRPIVDKPEINGEPGRYVATFRTRINFFASATVTTE